jgi:hypothetical protein
MIIKKFSKRHDALAFALRIARCSEAPMQIGVRFMTLMNAFH